MKIVSIESYVLKDQLKESFYFSQWEYSERKICIVKITCDTGQVGWGEGYGPAPVIKAGVDFLKTFIVGQNPLESETIWNLMYRRTLDYARSGVLVSAMSAIDVALWDLKGKILDLPVHTLLGGKKRETIMPYATGMYFTQCEDMPETLAAEAQSYVKQGFKAMKIKVGLTLEKDIENVKRIREAIGPDIKLMVDANHAYNLREAVQLCKEIEQYNIGWFEEPISPEYYHQYNELRSKTSIPISGGECEYLRFGFHRLLTANSVDIVQPDICASGGLTEAKRISALATTHGVEIVPHTWGTGIALAAATHFIANLDIMPGRMFPDAALMEYDRTENALRDQLTRPAIEINEEGQFKISDKPGLGLDLNEEVLYNYAIEESKLETTGLFQ